jgi:hypothetical protein
MVIEMEGFIGVERFRGLHPGLFGQAPGFRNINERKLQAMGVDRGLTERFLNHTQLNPRHKTVIVASLEKLSGTR